MKTIREKKKDKSIFNFETYRKNADYFLTKLKNLVDDQIKVTKELETQAREALNDEKTCILMETPSQQKRRMFNANDMISSSPLNEKDMVKLDFESVIRKNVIIRQTHFDESIKQKLFTEDDQENEEEPLQRSSLKRKAQPVLEKPINKKIKTEITSNQKLIKSPNKNTTIVDRTLKDTNASIFSVKVDVQDKKERARKRIAEVESRRKAAEEERKRKLEQKAQEDAKKEADRKARLASKKINKQVGQFTPIAGSNSRNTTNILPKIVTPFQKQNVMFSTPLAKPNFGNNTEIIKAFILDSNIPKITPKINVPVTSDKGEKENVPVRRDTFDHITPLKNNIIKTNITSYKITPEPVAPPKPCAPPLDETYNCYDILDLKSEDSTDDERHPSKPIPPWAQDKLLWRAIVSQNKDIPINGEEVFGPILPVERATLFSNPSTRFTRRTSSAHWESSCMDASLSKL